ncbi:MAG: sulfate/molybdate ABC transporter ATP-binding protein [Gemmataceae bacterium]|nr:sulfate/molybdate ABC transporter ATP-binding protein [Gemmataceae bacterium]
MSISVRNITKRFGKFVALDDVSLEAETGSLLALLGPSGCGKTTLLRIIAGLEMPDSGSVHHLDDEVTHRNARERNVGFVFQHFALFRHMTVFENVAFGLRVRHWPEDRIRQRVNELLHLVRMEEIGWKYPSQLSGGQRQRVALIRALAPEPSVLLLDEPFSALDRKVRLELRGWLRRFHDELGVTSIFVTHDQEEAFDVADKVVIMNRGRIEQAGTPLEVFEHPANAFVLDFLGNVNVLNVSLQNGKARLGELEMDYPNYPHPETRDAAVYVRPHELRIDRFNRGGSSLEGKVVHITPAGAVMKVRVRSDEFGLLLNVDLAATEFAELRLEPGDRVYVSPRQMRVFVPDYSI